MGQYIGYLETLRVCIFKRNLQRSLCR